jgi:glycosyltransferase involved in cell wall biosynthesis
MLTSMSVTRHRLLLAAPLPPPVGGTTVLSQLLGDWLRQETDIDVVTVDIRIRSTSPLGRILGWGMIATRIMRAVQEVDVVSVHASRQGMWILAPGLALLCSALKRPLLLRRFGGGSLLPRGIVARSIVLWSFKFADTLFVETGQLLVEARQVGVSGVAWLPNAREMAPLPTINPSVAGKVAFVGTITESKGIATLVAAYRRCSGALSIDLYGPLGSEMHSMIRNLPDGMSYEGELAPLNVTATLAEYSVLVLPTTYPGEGYPGVIIEAYGAGIPVIATRWRAIPELVPESAGILVEPGDEIGLAQALDQIAGAEASSEFVSSLRSGVARIRQQYDSDTWNRVFEQAIANSIDDSLASSAQQQ